ncbi:A disintegrin and metalloproteinase with thrombospondin motifs 12 [Leptinotarsa decemlineata]|uniref:A disintegrin and metalloproteinase with thrombospondin motifs 12 n=1 Tax=Leptinotarsa decemlineata TaxID=7539 RepID=UPI003D30C5D1
MFYIFVHMSMLTRNISTKLVFVVVMCMCLLYPAYSSSPLNGRYTESIEDYKLTVPQKLTRNGEFASFELPQYFEHDITKKRRRRSNDDEDIAHYGVTLNGQDYHVELWPNHEFISPDLIVERRDPKLRAGSERLKRLDEKVCHYTGHVRGHRNSRAALSTCDGLAGYITVDNKRYFIEPVEHHQANSEGHHLHVVHQSSRGAESNTNRCGTKSDWTEEWKKRFRNKFLNEKKENVEKRGVASEHRYLETLVVADKKFLKHHENKDVELYIMTVMNMVADFYHDSSSGNQMDVVVVRIMYLEKEEEEIDLVINTDADKTLSSFCKWQEKINPKDIENPNHHDIAVLLTRYDICADAGADCGLMGLAYVAAACTSNENCAINEDGGLVLGIVVAHEMGHVMGCSHDKEGESSCAAQDKDESYFVMAPYVHVFTTKWSTCSRGFITALFENSLGDCLNDEPQTSLYAYKYALPGTIYDAEAQCDIQFPGSKLCHTDEDKFCEMLLCQTTPDSCLSDEEPPQDGTKCGKNKWCFHKKCIEVGERPEAINGGWGSYGSWSSCSRTCGGGVSISQRECDNPVPQYGGRYCLGERKKYKICNKDPCPPDQPSFREVQCTEHNEKPFNGKLHTWTPQFEKDEPCVLYCSNEENAYAKLEPRVKDGTSCKTGTKNRCISGVCRKVGCDFQLDSDAVEDVCGICNGDGTQCKIIEEVYKDTGARDYKKVATIPQGSRNIDIKELAPSVNTLAISDKSEKVFYLNGNHIEDRDGDKKFGKVEGVYAHPEPGRETLVISGPIPEDLIFFVVFYSPENVGYRYRYAEPSQDLSYAPHYHWELLDWTDCSAKCGGGTQTSKYECVEDKAGKVSSTFCVGEDKPEPISKQCNENPCRTKWKVGKWGECHACKNRSGVRSREVECVEESPKVGAEEILVDDENCEGKRPASRELCDSHKTCKARQTDNIPAELLEDVWKQINRRSNKKSGEEANKVHKELNAKKDVCKNYNTTKLKLQVGSIVKDVVPAQEIKVIKVPLKQSHTSVKLSDNAFETMGDSVADKIDTGHAVIAVGKDAAEILKKVKDTPEEKEEQTTQSKTSTGHS